MGEQLDTVKYSVCSLCAILKALHINSNINFTCHTNNNIVIIVLYKISIFNIKFLYHVPKLCLKQKRYNL